MRSWAFVTAMGGFALAAATAGLADPPTDPALAAHCISAQPGRLALTDAQVARIQDIVRRQPDGPERRAVIMKVLTRAQWVIYWRTAGVAAC